MKKWIFLLTIMFMAAPVISLAGVKMEINDDSKIDLGFRVQTQIISTDNKDGTTGENEEKFNLRRGRFRLGGNVTKWTSFFLQTDVSGSSGGSGFDMRVIDAYATVNLHPLAKFYLGQNMAPGARQILTSSGALMAIDRPAITNYNLTWGLNGRFAFNTSTLPDGNLALSGGAAVRDMGLTLFGSGSASDMVHFKYYAGVYDGIQTAGEDSERFTGRVQINLFDSEPGYYNSSTYLGKKKTIGIGASYDTQSDIATDAVMGSVDYAWYAIDVFAELPLGPGALTVEGGYQDLDLDGATQMDDGSAGPVDARQTQGNGWYVQTGYFIPGINLQPWAGYSTWETDAADGTGSFDAWKVGFSYFFKGHNANIKVGYESVKADTTFGGSNEDSINTFLVGMYITY